MFAEPINLEVDNINCRRRKFKIASNDEKPDERSEYLEAATVSTPKDQIETLSQPETFEFEVVERHGEMEVPKKYSIPLMSNVRTLFKHLVCCKYIIRRRYTPRVLVT